MGLGHSVESLGNNLFTPASSITDRNIVREGLAIGVAWMAINYVYLSASQNKMSPPMD